MKTKQTVMKRNGRNKDKVAGFIVEKSGIKTYKSVKIKDQFPDKWNGRSPIYYMITRRATYKSKRIDNRFPDEWNGRSPIGHK